jgi:hypothetical protein
LSLTSKWELSLSPAHLKCASLYLVTWAMIISSTFADLRVLGLEKTNVGDKGLAMMSCFLDKLIKLDLSESFVSFTCFVQCT